MHMALKRRVRTATTATGRSGSASSVESASPSGR